MVNPTIETISVEISKTALRIGCFSKNETKKADLCSGASKKTHPEVLRGEPVYLSLF
jgi:hypothetical protein